MGLLKGVDLRYEFSWWITDYDKIIASCYMGHCDKRHVDIFVDLRTSYGAPRGQHRLHFVRKWFIFWAYDHSRSTRVVNGAFHDCKEYCSILAGRVWWRRKKIRAATIGRKYR